MQWEFLCCICQTSAHIACKCNDKLKYFCNTHFMLHLLNRSIQHSTIALEYNNSDSKSSQSRFDPIFKDLIYYQVEVENHLALIADLKHDFFLAITDIYSEMTRNAQTLLTEIQDKKLAMDTFKKNPTPEFEKLYIDYKQSGLMGLLNYYQPMASINLAEVLHHLKVKLKIDSEFEDEKVVNLRDEKESILTKLKEAEKQLILKNDKIETILKESEHLKDRFSYLHDSNEILEEKVWELEKEISEIKEILTAKEDECIKVSLEIMKNRETYQVKLTENKQEMNELKETIVSMEERCYHLEKNLEHKTHLLSDSEKLITELKQQIQNTDEKYQTLTVSYQLLQDLISQVEDSTQLKQDLESLAAENKAKDEKYKELIVQYQDIQDQISQLNIELAQVKDVLELTILESKAKDEKYKELIVQYQDIQDQMSQLNIELAQVKDVLELTILESKAKDEKHEALIAQHQLLQDQITQQAQVNPAIDLSASENHLKDVKYEELMAEFQDLEEEIVLLKTDLELAYAEIESKEEVILNLHELLDQNNTVTHNKIDELNQEMDVLKYKLNERENTFQSQSSDMSLISEDSGSLHKSTDSTKQNPDSKYDIHQEVEHLTQHCDIKHDSENLKSSSSSDSSYYSPPIELRVHHFDEIPSLINFEQFAALNCYKTPIASLAVSFQNRSVLTTSNDHFITIWSLDTTEQLAVLSGHKDSITSLILTHDNNYVISSSKDTTIRIWNLLTCKIDKVLYGHTQAVYSIALTGDDKFIVSCSDDDTIRLWCKLEPKCQGKIEGVEGAWCIAIGQEIDLVACGNKDGSVILWNLMNKSQLARMTGHTDVVNAIKINENNTHLMTASRDRTIRVWNITNLECEAILLGHSHAINSLSILGDNLFSCSSDQSLRIWNLQTKSQVVILNLNSSALALSMDDKELFLGLEYGSVLGYKF